MDHAFPATTLSRRSHLRLRTTTSGPRIALAGKLTAMDNPGGGETQMLATTQGLSALGVDAHLWRPWEEPLGQFDVLHLFGSLPEHLPLVEAAKRQGVKVVISTIAWFDLASSWATAPSRSAAMWSAAKFMVRGTFPRLPSWRRKLYQAADLLLPNSQAEAEQLMRYFRVPAAKIRVVPNGADPRFADPRPDLPPELRSLGRYILYPGRIEPRKNQLTFLRAMRGSDTPIVMLGDVVPGHEDYYRQCRQEATGVVRFLSRVGHDSLQLEGCYRAAGCLALCSWFETPGLVALEAAMSGVPLVLPLAGSAREYFGPHARYVAADDQKAIREQVLAAFESPRNSELARLVRQRFTWTFVAQRTREAYEQLD
jgi:glycosyltransferase involved in cell wall biosynthesis